MTQNQEQHNNPLARCSYCGTSDEAHRMMKLDSELLCFNCFLEDFETEAEANL
jgi:hypothetical protein